MNTTSPSTRGLRYAYTLWAPIYDHVLGLGAMQRARRHSLSLLHDWQDKQTLICGIGSGLDIPHLPSNACYTGVDVTPAMLRRAKSRAERFPLQLQLVEGNVMQLPFEHASFDRVVMHLILAVVPDPQRALGEALRVLKPGGEILILDKFLHPGQKAPLRKALNRLSRHIATRTDVVFENILAPFSQAKVMHDEAALFRGWFRHIIVSKME